jgi:germination protein M
VDPRWANALTAVGLLGFMGLVSLTAPRWSRSLRQPLTSGSPEEDTSSPAPAGSPSPEAEGGDEAEHKINVKLFFEAKDQPGLVVEERSVPFHPDLSGQLRAVVEELIRGSQSGLVATLNSGTRVLDVFVTARGVAYVDLSKEVTESFPGGSEAERLTVYSVVNSITSNLPAIKRVQILVDDRPVATLAGHVDLTRPLSADLTLLAAMAAPASQSPAPSAPSAAPSPTS